MTVVIEDPLRIEGERMGFEKGTYHPMRPPLRKHTAGFFDGEASVDPAVYRNPPPDHKEVHAP